MPISRTRHAKDYGSNLIAAGFVSLGQLRGSFSPGDVVVIQPIEGHPDGHMAMFDGSIWISDFKQQHGLYPGASYRAKQPKYTVFRYVPKESATPPVKLNAAPSRG